MVELRAERATSPIFAVVTRPQDNIVPTSETTATFDYEIRPLEALPMSILSPLRVATDIRHQVDRDHTDGRRGFSR